MEIPSGDYCVYRHIRPDTNQPFYIGISRNILRPYNKSGRGKRWKKVVKANHGEYRVQVLFECVSLDFAKDKEVELIELYGREFNDSGTLCNIHKGGEGTKDGAKNWLGKKHTDETRAKMSAWQIGKKYSAETLERMRLAQIGKKQSPEHIEKVRQTLFGRNMPENAKMAMSIFKPKFRIQQIDLITGEVIATHLSCKAAARAIGVSSSSIMTCVNGRRPSGISCGYKWVGVPNPDYIKPGAKTTPGSHSKYQAV